MTAPSQDLIDRLQVAATEARATITELHQARADARQVLREVDARMANVRSEVIAGCNELAMREWKAGLDGINFAALGRGLKESFDKWLDHLTEAKEVLDALREREQQMAHILGRFPRGRLP